MKEGKTELGKPTCLSLEIEPLSVGCGHPKSTDNLIVLSSTRIRGCQLTVRTTSFEGTWRFRVDRGSSIRGQIKTSCRTASCRGFSDSGCGWRDERGPGGGSTPGTNIKSCIGRCSGASRRTIPGPRNLRYTVVRKRNRRPCCASNSEQVKGHVIPPIAP